MGQSLTSIADNQESLEENILVSNNLNITPILSTQENSNNQNSESTDLNDINIIDEKNIDEIIEDTKHIISDSTNIVHDIKDIINETKDIKTNIEDEAVLITKEITNLIISNDIADTIKQDIKYIADNIIDKEHHTKNNNTDFTNNTDISNNNLDATTTTTTTTTSSKTTTTTTTTTTSSGSHNMKVDDINHNEQTTSLINSKNSNDDNYDNYDNEVVTNQPLPSLIDTYALLDETSKLDDVISIMNIIYYNYCNDKLSTYDNINKSYINKYNVEIDSELVELARHIHDYQHILIKKYIKDNNVLEILDDFNINDVIEKIDKLKNSLENSVNINLNEVKEIKNKNHKNKINYYNNLIKQTDISSYKTKEEIFDYLWLYYSYLSSLLDENGNRAASFKNKNINSYQRYFSKYSAKLYKQTRDLISKNTNKSFDEILDNVNRFCLLKKTEVYNRINNFNNIISNNH